MAKRLSLDDLRTANPAMAKLVDAALAPGKRSVLVMPRRHGRTAVAQAVAALARNPRPESKLEIRFDQQLVVDGLPPPIKNYLFLPNRDLEIDRAWPQWKLGVEIQGGAHGIKANLARDCEKLCLALLAGWWILPFSREIIRGERAIELLHAAIDIRKRKVNSAGPG